MFENCQNLVDTYINWLRQKISIENLNGTCEITTPFLDRHNDWLQIYVKKTDNGLILTDDSNTISDLQLSGIEFKTTKRIQMLHTILNGFGIQNNGEELFVKAKFDNFPQKKHNLIQAILAVNDLFALASPIVISIFKEDVEKYLRLNDIRFLSTISFIGKSSFIHNFDFAIPASKEKPERIIKTINRPDRQQITSFIFAWEDTKGTKTQISIAVAILNDEDKNINPDLINALDEYDIKTIPWSKRNEYIKELIE